MSDLEKKREYQRDYQKRNRERLNAYRRERNRRLKAGTPPPVSNQSLQILAWPDTERRGQFCCRGCREWTTDGTAIFCRTCWQRIFEQGKVAVPAPVGVSR